MTKALGKILGGSKPNTNSGAPLASLLDRWVGTERLAADVPLMDAGRAEGSDRASGGFDAPVARRQRSRMRARKSGTRTKATDRREPTDETGRGGRWRAGCDWARLETKAMTSASADRPVGDLRVLSGCRTRLKVADLTTSKDAGRGLLQRLLASGKE
jgi:hypothetical protein